MPAERSNSVCLAIGGLDPSGGAGIIADTRAIVMAGSSPAAAVTSVTFQNSGGVAGVEHMPAASVERQMLAVLEGAHVGAVKTGMLPTPDIIAVVSKLVREHELSNLVIDPVLRSTSGYLLIDDESQRALMTELMPLADLVTPNVLELEKVSGISIEDLDDVRDAAVVLHEMGARAILIKGGHMPESINRSEAIKDFLSIGGEMTVLEAERIDGPNVRGTGCMLASSIAAHLGQGQTLIEAVRFGREFIHQIIRQEADKGAT
jgi:hydroxymethylpyrimidine kinase/phosphomethylpyrimidine kinase